MRPWLTRGVLAGLLCLAGLLPALAQDKPITPDAAWQRLKDGNARFAADKPTVTDRGSKRRVELAQQQRPIAALLSCADSRVIPEAAFDQGLGELFVLRVAGNVGGPDVYASLEYAVAELQTPLIAVIGHTNCGAVAAALKGKELPSDHLKNLIGLVHLGTDLPKDKQAALDAAVRSNVRHHASELTKQSAILKDFVGSGRVKIVTGVYVLKTGAVEWLEAPR